MLGRRLAGASAVLAAVVVVALSSLPTTDAARTVVEESNARICDLRSVGGGGLLLGHDFDLGMGKNKYGEDQPLKGLQIILYLVGLLWAFLAVGIVADMFMEAIEVITSKEVTQTMPDGAVVTYKVWNATVANLSLMALGSSAPEILLSVLEIMGSDYFSGKLGPSTIVGSAAFNLLVILAVCCSALPDGESRRIADMTVFGITAVSSLFAYMWLIVILQWNTKDIVDPWEGCITLAFFPVLLALAYFADKGYFHKGSKVHPASRITDMNHPEWSDADTKELIKQYKAAGGTGDVNDPGFKNFMRIMAVKNQKPSRAAHRINAMRGITGGKRVIPDSTLKDMAKSHAELVGGGESLPFVQFQSSTYMTYESGGHVELMILRAPATGVSKVEFETVESTDGHACTKDEDYKYTKEMVTFEDGESSKTITIGIIDDDEPEEDEHFYVELKAIEGCTVVDAEEKKAKVTIIDDDMPGEMCFDENKLSVVVSENCGKADFVVQRVNGSKGVISCSYKTVDGTALAGKDYVASEGRVEFQPYEMTTKISIEITDTLSDEKSLNFKVLLDDPQGPTEDVKIHANDNGTVINELTVTVAADEKAKQMVEATTNMMKEGKVLEISQGSWADQFSSALKVNGGEDDEDADPPTTMDYVMHFITVPWKLFFAVIPPPDMWGGWLCFFVALAFTGLVTALIGDLAGMFGCSVGLDDSITAITLVALGTSLPDTFASKAATLSDDTADAAIGNVTGSNSVNVFLGLGLPWAMASIYWANQEWDDDYVNTGSGPTYEWATKFGTDYESMGYGTTSKKMAFVVPAGDLSTSVGVFTGCSLVCIGTLLLRRKYLGVELGGPKKWATLTSVFFVFLWFIYILTSIIQVSKSKNA